MNSKILLLDNYDSFTYNLFHALKQVGVTSIDVFRNDKIDIAQAREYDRILLSPGPGIPCEAGIMPQLITELAGERPILGICLGHQAMAEAYGGRLFNLPHVMHGKETEIEIDPTKEPLFQGLSPRISVGRYHSWVVSDEDFPDCLEVTARDDDGQIMALRHKEYDLVGFQFHPESVMTPDGNTMLRHWIAGREM
ncbi:MAG: aminodeoxychorismate/anthranilate synthase component II [Bdellovibrionales bacterium]|nr:aminodeoxychorismate/anthranilate synthase component II [Bdellovibrionales bacterium]